MCASGSDSAKRKAFYFGQEKKSFITVAMWAVKFPSSVDPSSSLEEVTFLKVSQYTHTLRHLQWVLAGLALWTMSLCQPSLQPLSCSKILRSVTSLLGCCCGINVICSWSSSLSRAETAQQEGGGVCAVTWFRFWRSQIVHEFSFYLT